MKNKLEDIFSWFDYQNCIAKIQSGEPFSCEYVSKDNKVKFRFGLYKCANGLWTDDLYTFWDLRIHAGGYVVPRQRDEVQSYEEICDFANEWLKGV